MILPIISGILLALSMPGPNLGWLAWIALIPLFFVIQDKSSRAAFKISFSSGIAFFGVLLYWLYSIWDWAGIAIIPGYVVLIIYLSLYWGVFGACVAWLNQRLPLWAVVFAAPALWVALEFFRSLTRFGFPWGQAADAIYQQLEFVQLASVAGIWGVSFLVIFINYLFAAGLRTRQLTYPIAAVIILVASFAWGASEINQPIESGKELNIALVQPSIPQRERSDATRLDQFMSLYNELLQKVEALPEKPDLVVLPESALPAFILDDPTARPFFENWVSAFQTPMIIGTFSQNELSQVFNSVAYFSLTGPSENVYSKVQLVPFSTEYFPGIELLHQAGLSAIIPVSARLGRITPGEGFFPIPTDWGPVATPICFESIFPQISRQFVQNGAELILVVTNDAWFKKTWALDQHFAKGVYRAVENGRYFAQAANSGISGIIDSKGKIIERSSVEDRSVTTGRVSLLSSETLFTQFGDWLIYLSLAYLVALFIIARLRGGRSPSPES